MTFRFLSWASAILFAWLTFAPSDANASIYICSREFTAHTGWTTSGVGWSASECADGLTPPTSGLPSHAAIGHAENGNGTQGDWDCTVTGPRHYNNATLSGATTGHIDCMYVDSSETNVIICDAYYYDPTNSGNNANNRGNHSFTWSASDCTGSRLPNSNLSLLKNQILGAGSNGPGISGMATCSSTGGTHYNYVGLTSAPLSTAYWSGSRRLYCAYIDDSDTRFTLCKNYDASINGASWSTEQWKNDGGSPAGDCTNGLPRANARYLGQSRNGSGASQPKCYTSEGAVYLPSTSYWIGNSPSNNGWRICLFMAPSGQTQGQQTTSTPRIGTSETSWQVATDSSGNVYVAEGTFDCLRKLSPTGTILANYPSGCPNGSNDSFKNPSGVAVDSAAGYVYVTLFGNGTILARVVRLPLDLSSLTTIAGTGTSISLSQSIGATLDSSGDLYILDNSNSGFFPYLVRKLSTPDGTPSISNVSGGSNFSVYVKGIHASGSGAVFVTDGANSSLYKVYGGSKSTVSSSLSTPWGITSDTSGAIYVAENSACQIRKISTDQGTGAYNFKVWAGGVSVCDDTDGVAPLASGFNHPLGITVAPDGSFYILEAGDSSHFSLLRRINWP